MVPSILYGAGKTPVAISIAHKDLFKACENEAFFSHILDITLEGKIQKAILKDLQRHPSKNVILHADFMRVEMDQVITVEVPLRFVNEDSCVGVKQGGGNISRNMASLEVSCLPGDLPEYIEVDIEGDGDINSPAGQIDASAFQPNPVVAPAGLSESHGNVRAAVPPSALA